MLAGIVLLSKGVYVKGSSMKGRDKKTQGHQERRESDYYRPNRTLGRSRDERPYWLDDEDEYDDFHTGKQENYKGEGYYGSNYGSITEHNRGRDYETNAAYRDQYRNLTGYRWNDIEEPANRRGFDLHWHELERRGVHKGKGPRGYQRSDLRITEDVNDILFEDPYIDASEIEVQVENGEVILTGEVENRNIKRRVEDVIEENVSGVRHLENRLRVRHERQITSAVNSRTRIE